MDPDAPIHVPPTLLRDPGTDLLSTYWPAVVLMLFAILAVAFAVRTARRRHRRNGTERSRRARVWSASSWSTGAAILVVASLALGVNTWVGYFPSIATFSRWVDDKVRPPAVSDFPKSAVAAPTGKTQPLSDGKRVTTAKTGYAFLAALPSSSEKVPTSGAWVYLPPNYDKRGNTAHYPLMIVMHGSPGSAADWFAGGRLDYILDTLIEAGDIPPMVVVSPDLNAGTDRVSDEPLNIPGGPQLEDYVTKDAVHWAETHFRTIKDPEHRIIAGMSSGGLASVVFGLHHPDTFGNVISMMPYAHPYTRAVKNDPKSRAENSPLQLIAQRGSGTTQKIFLGQGNGEPATDSTEIRDALRAQGQTTTLRILPNMAHSWMTARSLMPYGLMWTAQENGWVAQNHKES